MRATIEHAGARLRLAFELAGAIGGLAIPAARATPGRRERLWEHTCFEAFFGPEESEAYLEVNLAPSGEWAVWAFDAYREGMRPAEQVAAVATRITRAAPPAPSEGSLRLEAEVTLPGHAASREAAPLRAGLAAVLEDAAGRLSYWACRHPRPAPDFHAREGWPLLVYPPTAA